MLWFRPAGDALQYGCYSSEVRGQLQASRKESEAAWSCLCLQERYKPFFGISFNTVSIHSSTQEKNMLSSLFSSLHPFCSIFLFCFFLFFFLNVSRLKNSWIQYYWGVETAGVMGVLSDLGQHHYIFWSNRLPTASPLTRCLSLFKKKSFFLCFYFEAFHTGRTALHLHIWQRKESNTTVHIHYWWLIHIHIYIHIYIHKYIYTYIYMYNFGHFR